MPTTATQRLSHQPRTTVPHRHVAPGAEMPDEQSDEPVANASVPDLAALARQFEFIVPEAVLPNLQATKPHEAIRALLGSLVEAGAVPEASQHDLLSCVLRREEMAPTAVGCGVAIPHTKHQAVTKLVGTIGYCREGIEFDSIDGKPVHLVFLLVSPHGNPADYLRAMQAVSRYLLSADSRAWSPPPRPE